MPAPAGGGVNRPAVRALCSSWITSTCRCPPLQNRTVSASAGSIGSSGGGIDRSSSLSRVRTARTRVAVEPVEDTSACAPSPSVPARPAPGRTAPGRGGSGRLPPLDPDQLDEGREEDAPVATGRAPGPVQGEGGRTVVLGQAGTGRVRRLGQEQVDDPGDEEVLLVDQVDVRPAAQRRQEPLQRLTRCRAAEELPGLELVRREPEPGPQRRDQLRPPRRRPGRHSRA